MQACGYGEMRHQEILVFFDIVDRHAFWILNSASACKACRADSIADVPDRSLASRALISVGCVGTMFCARSLKRFSLDEALLNTSKGSGPCGTDGAAKSAAMTSCALVEDAAGRLALEARPSRRGLMESPPSCAEGAALSADVLAADPEPDGVGAV